MNAQHSIGMPTRCEISAIGLMSAITVRAAQFGLDAAAALIDNLARQPFDVADDVRPGAGQADVRRVDAEPVDQVQDLDLLLDRRTAHRRRLQAVAQRLVVQHHRSRRCAAVRSSRG